MAAPRKHHSRISTLMIDCLDERFDAAVDFWAGALGLTPHADDKNYVTLGKVSGPLFVRLQRVKKDPGFHIDVETDEMAAERRRLEQGGGRTRYKVKRWWVMEDPSGNPLCLVRPESAGFPHNAKSWRRD